MTVTLFTYMFSALHRYILIVHNRPAFPLFKPKVLLILMPGLWVFGVVTSIPFVIGGQVSVNLYQDHCIIQTPAQPILSMLIGAVAVALPFIAIPALYVHIYIVIYKAARTVHVHTDTLTQERKRGMKKENQTAFILFVLSATFLAMFLPMTLQVTINPSLNLRDMRYLIQGVWSCVYIGYGLNPLLYGALFKDIRNVYKSLFKHK